MASRTSLLLLIIFMVLSSANVARADELISTLDQNLYEVSHSVEIRLEKGVAIYKVQRVFTNPGTIADEAVISIDLPHGAAATGLRIRARKMWHDGELMEAEKAAAMYQELTGHGSAKPKDPALLQWQWADNLLLQIFPVMPGQASTVEYTLTVPTHYRDGRVILGYPRPPADAKNLVAPVVTVSPGHGDGSTFITVDGRRVTPDAPVTLVPPGEPEWAGEGEPDPSAGTIVSRIEVPKGGADTATAVTVDVDIVHTYKGDLRVVLVTPQGEHVALFDREGSGDNDLKKAFQPKLPKGTTVAGTWALIVSDHAGLDNGTLNGWTLKLSRAKAKPVTETAGDTPRMIPDAPDGAGSGGFVEIRVEAPAIDLAALRLGAVTASAKNAFSRLEIDFAARFSELPKAPSVVFVLDASHSIEPEGIAGQLQLVRAYLLHVPDAEVELVAVRRRAERVFGEFVKAQDFEARLAAAEKAGKLAPGNGSALELGVAEAGAALTGRKGVTRIVALTDHRLRAAFVVKLAVQAAAKSPKDTVLHVVEPRLGGELEFARDDTDPLFPVAKERGGIFAIVEGLPGDTLKEVSREVLQLVRPIKLEHFVLKGAAFEDVPEVIREGEALRMVLVGKKEVRAATLEGQLWSRKVTRSVKATADFSKASAAFVFGEDRHQDLTREEMLKVAFFGRAVSPVTSYLAIEPGTRPSTVGLRRTQEGAGGFGAIGHGSGGGGGSGVKINYDVESLMAPGVEKCVKTVKPAAGWSVSLDVEVTLDEVVDVLPGGAASAMRDCVVEVAWAIRLGPEFRHLDHETFPVTFQ